MPAAPPNTRKAMTWLLCSACFVFWTTATVGQEPGAAEAADQNETTQDIGFLDEVTVTAAHVPAAPRDTPGQVSIVTDEDIENHLLEDIADLVKYEPGVHVEGDSTRLGPGGFNIRGIGGNRVLTQVDGVPSAEQFDFGPFNVHQHRLLLRRQPDHRRIRHAG